MMSLFTPPTDNLYKFMALAGVVLIAAFAVPLVIFHQAGTEYLDQLRGSKELAVQERFTKDRLGMLEGRKQQVLDQKNKLQNRLDGLKAASTTTGADKLEGQIREANSEIEKIDDASHELSLSLALKRAQVEQEETVSYNRSRDSRALMLVGALGVLLGLFLSSFGFFLWYKKLQRYQDRLVTKEVEIKTADDATNKQIKCPPSAQPIPANVPEHAK
jgi:hypothetical protein